MAQICVGSLNKKVSLIERKLDHTSSEGSLSYAFTTIKTIWAKITAVSAYSKLNQINTEEAVTHKFLIRNRDDILKDKWFLYKSDRYKIVNVEPANVGRLGLSAVDSEDYLVVFTTLTGDESNEASGE